MTTSTPPFVGRYLLAKRCLTLAEMRWLLTRRKEEKKGRKDQATAAVRITPYLVPHLGLCLTRAITNQAFTFEHSHNEGSERLAMCFTFALCLASAVVFHNEGSSPSPCASPQPSFFALSNTPTTSHRTKMFSHSPNSPFKPLSLPSSPAWLMEGIPDDVPGLSHDSFADIGMGITPPRQRSDHFHSGLSPLESMSPPRQLFSSSKLENEMGCDETSW